MSNFPPGYRFYPTEEELVGFYLQNKLENKRVDMERVIPVADVYSLEPWQLPQISGEASIRDPEQWFFFCPRQEREAHGGRPTRTTPSGYWKATGSPSFVFSNNRVIGVKKTMVFYKGRIPNGTKTHWKMNEYRALEEDKTISTEPPKLRSEFSLCRFYVKSGCLRMFDRRPSIAATTTGETSANVHQSKSTPDASSSQENNPSMGEEACSQQDSSLLSGSGHDPTGGAVDWKIMDEIDWDSVDWD